MKFTAHDSIFCDTDNETVNNTDGTINGTDGTINDTIKLSDTESRILKAIENDPRITRAQISKLLEIGETTVSRATSKLKKSGFISREGSLKNGYWKILE